MPEPGPASVWPRPQNTRRESLPAGVAGSRPSEVVAPRGAPVARDDETADEVETIPANSTIVNTCALAAATAAAGGDSFRCSQWEVSVHPRHDHLIFQPVERCDRV